MARKSNENGGERVKFIVEGKEEKGNQPKL